MYTDIIKAKSGNGGRVVGTNKQKYVQSHLSTVYNMLTQTVWSF